VTPAMWIPEAIRTAWTFLAIHWVAVVVLGFAGPLLIRFTRPNKGR
jgi:hypothetical protein